MNDFNVDENMINKLKGMLDNGELSDVVSKISPEMIQNFSSMMNSEDNKNAAKANVPKGFSVNNYSNGSSNGNYSNDFSGNNSSNNSAFNKGSYNNGASSNDSYNNDASSNGGSSNFYTGFDFSNIDMNTVMKIKSVMDKMNTKDDPRTNLLRSLKPYLREERKDKVDQYANLMNVAQIAKLFNNSNDTNGKK